jgi:hypothetical protein
MSKSESQGTTLDCRCSLWSVRGRFLWALCSGWDCRPYRITRRKDSTQQKERRRCVLCIFCACGWSGGGWGLVRWPSCAQMHLRAFWSWRHIHLNLSCAYSDPCFSRRCIACQDIIFVLPVRVPDLTQLHCVTHCPLTPFPSSPSSFFFSAEGYVDTDVKLQKILAGILAAQTVWCSQASRNWSPTWVTVPAEMSHQTLPAPD